MKRFILGTVVLFGLALLAGGCGRSDRVAGVGPDRAANGASAVKGLTASPAGIPSQTTALVASRTIEMGSVSVWLDQDVLCVQYEVQPGWVLDAAHLALAAALGDIPLNPAGSPQVGRFPYSQVLSPGASQHTFYIDLKAAGLAEEPYLELAAQADVSRLSPEGQVLSQDGAWARGEGFEDLLVAGPGGKGKGGNWAMHFGVDMTRLRIPPGLLLWNKLGSQHEVEHSVVGPNGVIDGSITYLAGQYGNGFMPLPRTGDHNTPANFIEFRGLNLGQKGAIEFWYRPDWSGWTVGHCVEIITYGVPSPSGYIMEWEYNDWQDNLGLALYDTQGQTPSAGRGLRPSGTPGWLTSRPFHVAITWDGTASTPSDRLTLRFDGVPVGSFAVNGNPTFSGWDPNAVLRLATRVYSGDWDRHNWEGDHGVIDNLKVWNYPKTDFSDRFHE